MSEEKTAQYRVRGSNIRHKGKIVPIGKRISLAADEAERLKAFLEPLEQEDTGSDNLGTRLSDTEESLRQARSRIAELEQQLSTSQQAIETQKTEHETTVTELNTTVDSLKKTIEGLNTNIAELKKQAKEGGKK